MTLPILSDVWPLKHAADLLGLKAIDAVSRPVPVTDGSGPSWGMCPTSTTPRQGGAPELTLSPHFRSINLSTPLLASARTHGCARTIGPLTIAGIKGMHYGDIFYTCVGLMVYLSSWPDSEQAKDWPAMADFGSSWVAAVLLRNLVLEISFYEFWHQLLFGWLATDAITQHRYSKHNPYETSNTASRKPQMSVWRERFWSTNGFIWSTAWECFVVQAWASGALPACNDASGLGVMVPPPNGTDTGAGTVAGGGAGVFGLGCQMATPTVDDVSARPMLVVWFLLGFLITTQFRGIHFFCVHRCMHPWFSVRRSALDGDVGATLYRWVHSLHHKSNNPGPWSSLSMHPVEHLFYFSCFVRLLLLLLFFSTHNDLRF